MDHYTIARDLAFVINTLRTLEVHLESEPSRLKLSVMREVVAVALDKVGSRSTSHV